MDFFQSARVSLDSNTYDWGCLYLLLSNLVTWRLDQLSRVAIETSTFPLSTNGKEQDTQEVFHNR